MPKLPIVKARDFVNVLKKNGFFLARSDGSHHRYHHTDGRKVTVPYHNRPFKKGTLKSMLRQAGITTDALIDAL
jgi:predicted RNA binding protein YcfA (HicA-like mRNA interferase family)